MMPFLRQQKLELPTFRKLCVADDNDQRTLAQFQAEPKVTVYLEPDDQRDYVVFNADGSVTRVAACININGTQWIIPAQEKTKVPKSVYDYLLQCEETARRARLPVASQCLGRIR